MEIPTLTTQSRSKIVRKSQQQALFITKVTEQKFSSEFLFHIETLIDFIFSIIFSTLCS